MYKHLKMKIVVSIILALVIGILTSSYLKDIREQQIIVIAKEEIPQGTKLEKKHIETIKISKTNIEKLFPDAVSDQEEILGAITIKAIEKNKPIEKRPDVLIYDEEKSYALNYNGKVNGAYFIPEGKRLIAISTDSVGTLNYSLNKGDFVDVIFTSTDESTGGLFSCMLLQHMEIFDIEKFGKEKEGSIIKDQIITMIATPEECLKITVGNRNGKLDLALNPLNGKTDDFQPVNILSYVPDKKLSKKQKLENFRNYVKKVEVTDVTKQRMLEELDKEEDLQILIETIENINIDENQKSKLLEQLQ